MDRRVFLRRAAPAGLVAIAGCTDGGSTATDDEATGSPTESDGGTATASQTVETTDSPSGTDESTATATDDATATSESTPTATPPSDADQEVVVGPGGSLRFEPASFTVSAGDTVLWTWDSPGHNVSPTDGGQPSEANWPGKDEKTYGSGTTYVHTFETAGSYEYHCDPHQSSGMTGSFTVE